MNKIIWICISAFFYLFASIPPLQGADPQASETLPTVEQVLERYIEAVGGRDALEKLTVRKCTGRETTDLRSRDIPIYEQHPIDVCTQIPNRFYMKTITDGGDEEMGFDGKTSWKKDKCGVVEHEWAGKDRLAWVLNPQNALRIKEYFPELIVSGTEQVRGMMVNVLNSPDLHRPLFFNVETGLLVGFGHNFEIHDYREIDGVLFPHRIMLSRKGGSTTYEFLTVAHNVPIDEGIFSMPDAGQ